ncbi:MAG TPA: phosphatidate cytidylyltransferase [Hyphomonas sp.]|nr:phosphatidate cytidylyltransferase [Hyphomonas sp.]HRI99485.1 phosphatidate cytidylyltransferase [Hyphomonas sp.]HRK66064.1 phosphatidate cytidylyltransferase [Hyphomonas sp.]
MGDWTPPEKRFSELPLRLLTALILIPFALYAVWMGSWWLAAGCAAFCAVMILEWCRMSATPNEMFLAPLSVLFCLSLPLDDLRITASLGAAAVVLGVLSAQREREARIAGGFGVVYVFAMVSCLYVLREGPWQGRDAALYLMSFVWASDAAAYFFGRLLRGPRLLPKESPNKTWSGAISAVIACALCGYYAWTLHGGTVVAWVFAGILVSVFAQAGDLFESGLKRRFKVKDSGSILPGHGGLLDRVDGLGAVSVMFVLLFLSVPAAPRLLGL